MPLRENLELMRPQLVAYARAICRRSEGVDDLVQDAIVRALTAANVPEQKSDLLPWMFRVIRNLHLDNVRKERVRTEYFAEHKRLLQDATATRTDPLSALLVRQVFETLTPDHREILFLVDVMGMRYAEAARVLDVAEGTVMSRLSRARKVMVERIEGTNVAPMTQHRRRLGQ